MKDKICISLNKDHLYTCSSKIIGRAGENNCTQLEIMLAENLCDKWFFLDFEKPDGTKFRSAKLDVIDNVVVYDIPNSLLDTDGELKVQAVLQDESGEVWKSTIKIYRVIKSINASDEIEEKEDFITEAQNLLNEFEKVVDTIVLDGTGYKFLCDDGEYKEVEGGATGGTRDYEKLDNQPSINDVVLIGNKTLDDLGIQAKGDYALSSAVPTKVSQLINDRAYINEIELNNKGYLTGIPVDYKTKTENDELYQPKGDYALYSAIPTKTSDLANDSGFITGYTEVDPTVPSYVKAITQENIDNWNNPNIPTKVSDLENDSNFVTEGYVNGLVGAISTNLDAINGEVI